MTIPSAMAWLTSSGTDVQEPMPWITSPGTEDQITSPGTEIDTLGDRYLYGSLNDLPWHGRPGADALDEQPWHRHSG
ncbi:hypothetical protein GDO78_017548 [Eleutherodactylus coqui]|uniref:Uncharacterized protein n=1 Tax=Eleutherodactylus coqui TaxID=57060 RepID=A0A8J6B8C7_ELECQ|nr:hypothetical protein GDO78_017548 [Eleutherodactylus coqui]